MLKTQDKAGVENVRKKTTSQHQKKLEFTKHPAIAEFLSFQEYTSYYGSVLETSIIDGIQKNLMNLEKGYVLVAGQQHIHTKKHQ